MTSKALHIDDDDNGDWLHRKAATSFLIYQKGSLLGRCNIETEKVETKDSELEEFFYLLIDEGIDNGPIGPDDGIEFKSLMERAGYEVKEQQTATDCDEEKKLTQKEVDFEKEAKGKDRCENCERFVPESECQIVQSPVNPQGWCREFKVKAISVGDASTPDVYPGKPGLEAKNWDFQGLTIDIENLRGSTRHGASHHTRLNTPYGFIRGSVGADGDEVDVFVGAVSTAPYAFVIHTKDPETGTYDEDKVILGVESAGEAKQLFDENYDRPGFFESMERMTISHLKRKLKSLRGRKITA
jgi:hypothetical protein